MRQLLRGILHCLQDRRRGRREASWRLGKSLGWRWRAQFGLKARCALCIRRQTAGSGPHQGQNMSVVQTQVSAPMNTQKDLIFSFLLSQFSEFGIL